MRLPYCEHERGRRVKGLREARAKRAALDAAAASWTIQSEGRRLHAVSAAAF